MRLDEFVRETIEQVITGVAASRPLAAASEALVGSGRVIHLEFDVAVTVTESADSKKGGSLTVWGVGVNATGGGSSSNSTVSRVKFAVPLVLPSTAQSRGGGAAAAADDRIFGKDFG